MWRESSHRSLSLGFFTTETSMPSWDGCPSLLQTTQTMPGESLNAVLWGRPAAPEISTLTHHTVVACFILISCHLGAGQTRLWEDEAGLHDANLELTEEDGEEADVVCWSTTKYWENSPGEKYIFKFLGIPATEPILMNFCLSENLVIL